MVGIANPSWIKSGIFTIPEVAHLVQANSRDVRMWVEGQKDRQEPLIENQLGRVSDRVAVSFTNLMELRFIARFHNAGVPLKNIRAYINAAKNETSHPHPLATKITFKTDGKKIFCHTSFKNKDSFLIDLGTKNFEMLDVVLKSLNEDVDFDMNGEAREWKPRPKLAPNVVVNPVYSFGKPVLVGSNIPTETIAHAVKVEGDANIVSNLYEIPLHHVREAVRFENDIRLAA